MKDEMVYRIRLTKKEILFHLEVKWKINHDIKFDSEGVDILCLDKVNEYQENKDTMFKERALV